MTTITDTVGREDPLVSATAALIMPKSGNWAYAATAVANTTATGWNNGNLTYSVLALPQPTDSTATIVYNPDGLLDLIQGSSAFTADRPGVYAVYMAVEWQINSSSAPRMLIGCQWCINLNPVATLGRTVFYTNLTGATRWWQATQVLVPLDAGEQVRPVAAQSSSGTQSCILQQLAIYRVL